MDGAMGKFKNGAVTAILNRTIVADGFNWTTSQSFLGLLTLDFSFRLVESDTESNVIVPLEN